MQFDEFDKGLIAWIGFERSLVRRMLGCKACNMHAGDISSILRTTITILDHVICLVRTVP
jgi:hypothetical protein